MNFDSFATIDQRGGTPISAIHPDVIQTHILTRLDGPTLASASCTSSQLHALSIDDNLWRNICHHTWPSTADTRVQHLISTLPSGHRSFYSDSFPSLHRRSSKSPPEHHRLLPSTTNLISAVDIYYQNKLILSKVHESETGSGWFLSSPFRVDLLDPKETVPAPVKSQSGEATFQSNLQDNLTLSWILIDPTRKRSANFSSTRPVSVTQHWLTGDIQVRFATILSGERKGEFVQCGVVVTCGGGSEGGELVVNEVSLHVEDMEGKNLSGRDSLVILQTAMEGGGRKRGECIGGGEERERYEEYLRMKREKREEKQRRERRLDLACIATGVTIFVSWAFILFARYG